MNVPAWVDSARYWVALVLWITLPPALLYWVLVHPLAAFWRRLGAGKTFLAVLPAMAGLGYVIWLLREPLLADRYPFRWWLALVGVVLYGLAILLGGLLWRELGRRRTIKRQETVFA